MMRRKEEVGYRPQAGPCPFCGKKNDWGRSVLRATFPKVVKCLCMACRTKWVRVWIITLRLDPKARWGA